MKQLKDFEYIAFGITNICKDSFLLPFFDYDIDDLPNIVLELLSLQNKFKLSSIYVLSSSTGYNAFSLDKVTFSTLKAIYNESKLVDKDFIKWGLIRGFITLRMGIDKTLLITLVSRNIYFVKSLAHKCFFTDIMEFNIRDNINFDTEQLTTITMFPSHKHGFNKELFE